MHLSAPNRNKKPLEFFSAAVTMMRLPSLPFFLWFRRATSVLGVVPGLEFFTLEDCLGNFNKYMGDEISLQVMRARASPPPNIFFPLASRLWGWWSLFTVLAAFFETLLLYLDIFWAFRVGIWMWTWFSMFFLHCMGFGQKKFKTHHSKKCRKHAKQTI